MNSLLNYCQSQDWSGYDPFDGLNSRIFEMIPVLRNSRLARLGFLQLNKRCPVNMRPLLGIKKEKNPKAMGLFMHAVLDLQASSPTTEYLGLCEGFADWLLESATPGYSGCCWGYNFDWQSRAFFLPKRTPTVVNTSFNARAFLKASEVLGKPEYLATARSACDFILRDLNRRETETTLCFSYSPLDRYFVNNATALAASVLSGVYEKTGQEALASPARKAVRYVLQQQRPDGGWAYGEDSVAQKTGTDNFHTGFILESLKICAETLGPEGVAESIAKGLAFYQDNFFLSDGAPKYFPHQAFPIDIHSAAQAVVTLVALKAYGADQALCGKVVSWMIENMQDPKGFFYYQRKRHSVNRIPYMRWGQAWALHALATYIVSHGSES